MIAGYGSAEEFDYTHVIASTNDGHPFFQLRRLDFTAKLALENDSITAPEVAAPASSGRDGRGGSGGVALG